MDRVLRLCIKKREKLRRKSGEISEKKIRRMLGSSSSLVSIAIPSKSPKIRLFYFLLIFQILMIF